MKTKIKKRKSNSFILFICLLFLLSCGTGEHVRVRIEMPRKPSLNLDDYEEIAITNFLVKEEAKDFNINKELTEYFTIEFEQKIKNNISSTEVALQNEEAFQDKTFWQKVLPDKNGIIFFTGSLEYTEEIRKAIKSASKRRFEEPFPEESRIEERRFYSLSLDLYLIDRKTGEALYKRTFKESKAYKNPNQTAYFAFYDMMINIRDKLFRQIVGGEQIQERYLIK
ncbi:MAG: hypothetical protein JSV17_05595 [Candidatus Aminicenantes bacterium]|nr:MAG: hypothetical protein JSV17_05595 [Candidatus Aminicenantes bacterium]